MLSSTLVNINVFYKIRGHYQKISFCSPFFEIRKAKRTARCKTTVLLLFLMPKNGVWWRKTGFFSKKSRKNAIFQEKNLINRILRCMLCNLQYWGRDFCTLVGDEQVPENTVRCTRGFIKRCWNGAGRQRIVTTPSLQSAGFRSGRQRRVLYNIYKDVRKPCISGTCEERLSGGRILGRGFCGIGKGQNKVGPSIRRKRSRRENDTAWRKKRKKADYGSKSFN